MSFLSRHLVQGGLVSLGFLSSSEAGPEGWNRLEQVLDAQTRWALGYATPSGVKKRPLLSEAQRG